MQPLREVIRGNLARSLRKLAEEDRLSAALAVVCTGALGSHCQIAQLDGSRVVHLRVDGQEWMPALLGMRDRLRHDLQRVSGVAIARLHFVEVQATSERTPWVPRTSASEPLSTGVDGSSQPSVAKPYYRKRSTV